MAVHEEEEMVPTIGTSKEEKNSQMAGKSQKMDKIKRRIALKKKKSSKIGK